MNILLITEFTPKSEQDPFTGGVDARTSFIVKFLASRHKITVVSRSSRYVLANTASIFPRLLFQVTAFLKTINKKVDIVEGSNFVSYLPAWFAAKLKGVPAIAWFADVYQNIWFGNYGFFPAVTGWLLEKVALKLPWNQLIAMSKSTKRKLVNAGVPEKRITVIYGGVEVKKLRQIKVKKFPNPTVCTIARLVHYKRINDLINAVAKLRQDIPSSQLLIIGDGPEKAKLQSLAKSLNLEKNIRFLGALPHEQAMKTLKRCHLFSLPSLIEGFGLVTVEAMAAGVPYVNSRISATVEITESGKGGLLFEPRSSHDLAEKLKSLLEDKKLYQKKRQEGLKLVKRYDWDIIAEQTESVYQNTIKTNI